MNARGIVIALAAIGIPVAFIVALLPITWGYAGFHYGALGMSQSATGPEYGWVYYIDPGGPADRAGIRRGDKIIFTAGATGVQDNAGSAGTVIPYRVVRKDGEHVIPVKFAHFSGALAVQEEINKLLGALTALGAFIVAILVALRARERLTGARAATFLLLSGCDALCASAALVAGNAYVAMLFSNVLPSIIAAAALWMGLLLLSDYPPPSSAFRRALVWAGPIALVWSIVAGADKVARIISGRMDVVTVIVGDWFPLVFPPLVSLVLATQVLAAMRAARGPYRAPVMWLGGMWLAGLGITVLPVLFLALGSTTLVSHYGDLLHALSVFFVAFGLAYPVLRHRLVDLNILVTRASVYAIVSAIIVGVFIAGEWALGKVFETSLGLSRESGGAAAQISSLVLVLILGISARSIHRFVEDRLTNTFFRNRMAALATIQRVAHEADSATNLQAYMQLAVRKIESALGTSGAAFYLRDGRTYDLCAQSGAEHIAESYDPDDEAPLALRRWLKPFECEDAQGRHLLFLPMTVRGDLVGFLRSEAKTDHTAFLQDEIDALALLADRAAIASALLTRSPASPLRRPSPSLSDPTAART